MSSYSEINKKLLWIKTWKYYLQYTESWSVSVYKSSDWSNISKNIELQWLNIEEVQNKLNSYYFDNPVWFIKDLVSHINQTSIFDEWWLDIEEDFWDMSSFYEINEEKEELMNWLWEQIKKLFDENSLTKWRFEFHLEERWFLYDFNKKYNRKLRVHLITSFKKSFDIQMKIIKPRTNWYSSNYMYKLVANNSDWFDFFEKVWKNFQSQDELYEDINSILYELSNLYFWILEE